MLTEELIHKIERLEDEKQQLLEQRQQLIDMINKVDDRNSLKLQLLKTDMLKVLKYDDRADSN